MPHRTAVALMVLCTLLWSMAGIVTRQLETAQSFEVTFWRSAFNAIGIFVALVLMGKGAKLWNTLRSAGWPLWFSGGCWSIMYTAFMVAMTKTTVANVLITLSINPFLTALLCRIVLKQALPLRTWLAIFAAGLGIGWMFWEEAATGVSLTGTMIALGVPFASSCNLSLLQYLAKHKSANEQSIDMLPAVLIGATLSALYMLPLSWPFAASFHDINLLAMLGVFQLAIPCVLMVRLTKILPAAEISLLNLLEILFGITWVWLFANEIPSAATLTGGAIVIAALVGNSVAKLKYQPVRQT